VKISNDRIVVEHDSHLTIYPDEMGELIPAACPVCDHLLRTSDDEMMYVKFGCCDACAAEWAWRDTKSWNDGIRPTKDDIEKRCACRPKLFLSVA
jgi:hypothetical protein